MIKVKLSLVEGKNQVDLDINPGESLESAVNRSLKGLIPEKTTIADYFNVSVNAKLIEEDFWSFVSLDPADNIYISPKIKEGDNGSLIKTAAIIAITFYAGPAAGKALGFAVGSLGAGLAAAGVSIAASLALNSLFPPAQPKGLNLDNGSSGDASSSQMYALGGQSNELRRFQTVPKVYGTHRIFPPVAANTYVELEADPVSGNLIQVLYVIYDFGIGPVQVGNIQIGDTPIQEYADLTYKLVDFNKPAVSEGSWDDATTNVLTYYKGEVKSESLSLVLNKAASPSTPEEEYQATRNASPNSEGYKQEITVSFVFPQGLYAFNAYGNSSVRNVDLIVSFSKVDEDIWYSFNDPAYVEKSDHVGGSDLFQKYGNSLYPSGGNDGGAEWPQIGDTQPLGVITVKPVFDLAFNKAAWMKKYGLPKGSTTITLGDGFAVSNIGRLLRFNGEEIGKIISSTPHVTPGYAIYTFDKPTTQDYAFYTFIVDAPGMGGVQINGAYFDNEVNGKVTTEEVILGRTRVSRNAREPLYATVRFTPKVVGSYKVRVIRLDNNSEFNYQVSDAMTWTGIATRFDRDPIVTDKRHTFLEMKIRATNQLNGSVQNLSAVVSSVLDVYDRDTETWSKQVTSNPAWVFCDLLTGEVNKRAIDKSRLDMNSISQWAEYCDEVPPPSPSRDYILSRFSTNFVMDFTPTLQSVLGMITGAAQASLNIVDGKYGVLIDRLTTVPVQIFTPRNSKGFSSTRNYVKQPDGIKISYIDPQANWESREQIAYDTGFNVDNAVDVEEMQSFACTNPEQAFRYGRYLLAQNRLRQEKITITVDFENLVCTRGDFVQITQDVMKVGGSPARVKTRVGNRITIDDSIESVVASYGCVFRLSTGDIKQATLTIIDGSTFDLDGSDFPEPGDLVVIGVVGQTVFDCIVKAIEPADNMSATLYLIEKADGIYDVESSDDMPSYDPQISITTNTDFSPPGEVVDLTVADNRFECDGLGLNYFVDLSWSAPPNTAYETFEIYVDNGQGYSLFANTKSMIYAYPVVRTDLGKTHNFKVLAVSSSGKKLELAAVTEVTTDVEAKSTPPSDVEIFSCDITGEVLQLFWTPITDCSVEEYLIRYSPVVDGTWERSIPLLRVSRNTSLAATQARTGTYLIKAVDFEGNQSLNATAVITTIPNLFGLNIISETTDFPALPGPKDRVVTDGISLLLQTQTGGTVSTITYYPDGFYYYEQLLDLGEIYTVRLQSLIQSEGFTNQDLMINWPDLITLDSLSHAGTADWDVETYYRTTDTLNVIADWATLSDIDPISEGNEDNWTAWKKFTIGDATGRIFQFRLRLVSNKSSVTPRVFDGTIRADMPDRIESYENVSAPDTGIAITYTPAFKGPGSSPNIQISMESASSGDYWAYDYRTLDGFYIRFFDKDDNPVARTFDAGIKGFGRKATSVI